MKEQGKKSSKNTLYEQGCYLVDSKLPYFENQLLVPSKYQSGLIFVVNALYEYFHRKTSKLITYKSNDLDKKYVHKARALSAFLRLSKFRKGLWLCASLTPHPWNRLFWKSLFSSTILDPLRYWKSAVLANRQGNLLAALELTED